MNNDHDSGDSKPDLSPPEQADEKHSPSHHHGPTGARRRSPSLSSSRCYGSCFNRASDVEFERPLCELQGLGEAMSTQRSLQA